MKRIDLIPKKNRIKKTTASRSSRVIIFLILAIIVSFIWQKTAIIRYQYSIDKAKQEIQTLKKMQRDNEKLFSLLSQQRENVNQERAQIAQRLDILQQSRRKGIAWSKVLVEISAIVSKRVQLKELQLSEEEILLKGMAQDQEDVSTLMLLLDQSDIFAETGFRFMQSVKKEENKMPQTEFEVTTQVSRRAWQEK